MRFMVLVKALENPDAFIPPKKELMEAIGKMAEEGVKAGKMVETGGLEPPARGTRLSLEGGRIAITDGPFAESKELIGGYAIFNVDSRAEMVELTRGFLQVHADILGPSFKMECEVREIFQSPEHESGRR